MENDVVHCPSCHGPTGEPICEHCGGLIRTANGRYRVQQRIARNAVFGRSVYLAQSNNGPVALKEYAFGIAPDETSKRLFEREAAALGRVNHPNLPALIESFAEGYGREQRFYLAQTYIEGESVEDVISRAPLDAVSASQLARDCCDALAHLHAQRPQLIHRDIKPANIVRGLNGRFVLVDLGSLRVVSKDGSTNSAFAGTDGYYPANKSFSEANPASDFYALGVSLMRAITGAPAEPPKQERLDLLRLSSPRLAEWISSACKLQFSSAREALLALGPASPIPSLGKTVIQRVATLEFVQRDTRHEQWAQPLEYDLDDLNDIEINPWRIRCEARSFMLRGGGKWQVGRNADLSLSLHWHPRADTVSRTHAELLVTRAGLVIRDLASTNGTFLDGEPIRESASLGRPARLSFGKAHCSVEPIALRAAQRNLRPNGNNEIRKELYLFANRHKIEAIDKSDRGGVFWLVAGRELASSISALSKAIGVSFAFAERGGASTGRRPAWYWAPPT